MWFVWINHRHSAESYAIFRQLRFEHMARWADWAGVDGFHCDCFHFVSFQSLRILGALSI
jgi:hypothetical protein